MPGIDRCRSCQGRRLELILSLGNLPLANALLTEEQLGAPEPTFPLDLVFCADCSLVQIIETVPAERMFREYPYFSSCSSTLLAHAKALAARLVAGRGLTEKSLVVEVGCNDGYLLQHYRAAGIPVLGIEPARNVAEVATEKHGVPVLNEFFGKEIAARLAADGCRADVLHAHNVLAHAQDLNGFVEGIASVLKDTGIAIVEVPYVKDLVDKCEFDTIYHEHLCYFSMIALCQLFGRQGLVIELVERIPIHGGSLRLYVKKNGSPRSSVLDLVIDEGRCGINRESFYQSFVDRVEQFRRNFRWLLFEEKRTGARIAAYGAAAKGATLLNYCGINRETIAFVVDRNPAKQGRFMPGARLPIYPPERLLEEMPGYAVLLAWNFADEILAQQAEYRKRGGRFILPLPKLQVV